MATGVFTSLEIVIPFASYFSSAGSPWLSRHGISSVDTAVDVMRAWLESVSASAGHDVGSHCHGVAGERHLRHDHAKAGEPDIDMNLPVHPSALV